MDDSVTIVLDSNDLLSGICGANDGNLKVIEESLGGRIAARGNEIRLDGVDQAGALRFKTMMDNLISIVKEGEFPSPEYVSSLAGTIKTDARDDSPSNSVIQIPHGFRRIYPRGKGQTAYVQGMRACEICFCIGPAGTGKTYLAVAEALRLVLSKSLRKLVLTRPVVEAGENLGFLPGDLAQKISPYLRPLYDAMESLVPYEIIHRMEESRAIEIAPLAYMRGRSLNDCAVILDEAQNTTKEQMKMFLTRIGSGARAVITGDVTQIDLPGRTESGLLHASDVLKDVEGLHFSYLHTADVVRNPLIKKIIQAYNEKDA
ncbi:MAG: PhoH family protein [Treponema sp.]|jgi:phosphate starvation-inducible PhoH-like protein|nr:PhoH family protein [Treponema sp.]